MIKKELLDVLREVMRAWNVLPGGRTYSKEQIERWMNEDMGPVIFLVKIALRQAAKEK